MQLSKESIRKLAKDDVVYYRGARYFRENTVSNVIWSKANKVYHATVHGKNDYSVMVQLNNAFTCSCNCPDYVKWNKPCKHIVATLLFIEDYMERSEENIDTPERKKVFDILEYFNRQNFTPLFGETYEIKVTVTVPSLLKGNAGKAFVFLQAGNTRFYKIQNIKKFLTEYYKKENITLGKEFTYIHGESRFGRKSQKILDYFMEIYEIQESLGRVYYSNIFQKSDIIFTKNMLYRLFEILEEDRFTLILNEKIHENVRFLKQNPDIQLHISTREDTVFLDYEKDYPIVPVVDDGSLLLYENILYRPENEFLKNYLPFYNTLGNDREALVFRGEDKQRFLDLVLPSISEVMHIRIPESMREHYIDEELKVALYFDRVRHAVSLSVSMNYGEYSLNPLDGKIPADVIIIRKKEAERRVLDELETFGFLPHKDSFLLKDEELMYSFITEGIYRLVEEYEVYHSGGFLSISVQSAGKLHTTVSMNQDSDLIEMNMEFEDIPKEELKEVFHSLKLKKRYHRLKNGSFINLESEEARLGSQIVEHFHLNYKQQTEEGFRLPKYAAVHLDEYLKQEEQLFFTSDQGFQTLVTEILDDKRRNYRVPKSIEAELRNYQKKGFSWLRMLAEHDLGGILADDMGLGKTLESIVYMASFPNAKHLIICPTSLVYNWQDEFATFAPGIRTMVVSGTPENRQELLKQSTEIDVIITSYPLIRRDFEFYKEISIHTMFIDEAQFIKNPSSQNAKAVKKIAAKHKFALTGTPIENSLTELWSIFDFVLPGFLQTHTKFVADYEKPIVRDEDKTVLEELIRKINPFVLRRMKKDVLKELPEKIETRLLTEMTEKQKVIYLSYMNNIREELSKTIKENGYPKSSFQILSALTRLRQICCHPSTFIDNYSGESGKLELLMEQLPGILENGHRVLIFSQFTSMLQIIGKRLNSQGISYFYLDGSSKSGDRMDMVNRFNQGEKEVFLISLKAGGTGINLTGADTVIHYDPWWNPAVEEQATDRVYRIGQKNTVHVIRLLTKGTIEEKIYKLQKKKKELSNTVIDAKEVFINRLSREEVEELFRIEL